MKYRSLFILLSLFIVGCSDDTKPLSEEEPLAALNIESLFNTSEQTPEVMEKWARSCALCHVNGEGGAPRMGDREAWQSRLEKGNVQLLNHTVEGFNRMPPLGYCMDCEAQDYAAMINLMAGRNQ